MTLLIEKRLSASELVSHMGEWKKGGPRLQAHTLGMPGRNQTVLPLQDYGVPLMYEVPPNPGSFSTGARGKGTETG